MVTKWAQQCLGYEQIKARDECSKDEMGVVWLQDGRSGVRFVEGDL